MNGFGVSVGLSSEMVGSTFSVLVAGVSSFGLNSTASIGFSVAYDYLCQKGIHLSKVLMYDLLV